MRKNAQVYETLFRESSAVMMLVDPETRRIIDANNSAAAFYGYSLSELKGMLITDINILTVDEIKSEIERARFKKKDYFEFRHRLKNGEIRDVAVQSSPVKINGKDALFSIIRDISEKIKLENDLKTSEMRFRSYIEKSPLPIFIVNRDGYINYANPAAVKMIASSEGDVTGRKAGRYAADDEEKRKALFYSDRIDSEGEVLFDLSIKNMTGDIVYLIIKAVKLADDEYILFCLDITKRREAELHLLEEKKRAEKASMAKSDFLSHISHELKTPLNGVIGFAELMLSIEKDAEKKEMLSLILESGENLTALISDILDFVKTENDTTQASVEIFSIHEFMHNTGKIFALLAGKKGLSFSTGIADNVPEFVKVSKSILRHVTGNLLSNAVKYTEEGLITFSVTRSSDPAGIDTLVFKVEDTGIGIHSDNLDRIFDKFEREKNTLTDKYGGLGLGLSIVKNLVERCGGYVSVQSEKGRGSIFTAGIAFSIADQDHTAAGNTIEENKTTRELKILAAEDDRTNMYLLEKLITSRGWRVDLVENGGEVLRAVSESDYDIIILDINLPVLDGLQTVRRLREMGVTVPVMALTAYSSSKDCERCIDAGMDGYLSKPVIRNSFYNMVESLLKIKPD